MTVIATDDRPAQGWSEVFTHVQALAAGRGVRLCAVVVLVPYAQLMAQAARQWQRLHPQGFAPRFETTRNWAVRFAAPAPHASEYTGERARDAITARALLERAGLGEQREMLAALVLEMAAQLAGAVAAVAPGQRAQWGEAARALLPAGGDGAALRFEAAAARVALEWVLASRHASDVLFAPQARQAARLLVVLGGLQPDPLAQALLAHWGEDGWSAGLHLPPAADAPCIALHAVDDGEAEAQRAAACVLAHLAAARAPVALAATDRALTRRVSALLHAAGVSVQDETGWALSTTRASAQLMALLRACAWDAPADEVLDWLKHCPGADAPSLHALERWLRRQGERLWSAGAADLAASSARHPLEAALAAQCEQWRARLQAARPLAAWLAALRQLLQDCGAWDALEADPAGERVLAELRLPPGLGDELHSVDGAGRRLSLAEFTRWAGEVLESARFRPEYPDGAPVVVLPLAQLLARPFAALVVPGCDEKRLQAAPEPPGPWTAAQREGLGLPTREALAQAQRAAWQYALGLPHVELVWRTGDGRSEPLLASPLVQALRLLGGAAQGQDACVPRAVAAAPVARPRADGRALPLQRLSASAYADLRHCPYRFFALRQLGLQEDGELDGQVDKRDFGTWLHRLLQHFHEGLAAAAGGPGRAALMDEAAARATRELRLEGGDFLPWASGWPLLREGYLDWLSSYEAAERGAFAHAELRARQPLAGVELIGTLDRVDVIHGAGQPPVHLIIDYKSESATRTRERIGAGGEDIQLAFYAALMPPGHRLRAAYLNVGERGEVRLYEQDGLEQLHQQLLRAIEHDMARIAEGELMQALGEGAVCDWCAARGLCRRDFWND
ncbi:PD-(D/E)XK nuclease family protein [Pulveribacter suum]|uniref:Exonuclease n=1 Tax=Pulveribacter suum TaxID=2116657 RepID=A0A2P1NKH1_9BURK|nr:PD-(D/E)XK nuclease family protein [Pulveribacter suum]AVP57564.1 exonuclease [Pulveribacter suum]